MSSFSTQSLLCLGLLLFLSVPVLSQSNLYVVLKCYPLKTWRGTLTVTIIRAWDLKGDYTGMTEAYIKMWHGSFFRRTRMIRSYHPQWDAYYNLGEVDTRLALEFELWDEDVQYDDLLVSCKTYPKEGTYIFSCWSNLGRFELEYTLECDCPFTGSRCEP